MRFQKSFLSSLFLLLSYISFTQNVEFSKDFFPNNKDGLKKAKENIELGDSYFEMDENFLKLAIAPYLEAYKFNSNNALLNFKLGKCYLFSSFKQNALPYLEKAKNLDKSVDVNIDFHLGQAYHLANQWDKAMGLFYEFKSKTNSETDPLIIKKADKEIEECKNGKVLSSQAVRVKIENLGKAVNTEYHEYKPLITADESMLFFTSRRPNSIGKEKDPVYNDFYEDIYYSVKQNDGKWSEAKNLNEPVNTADHDANSGLSVDGSKLVIYIGSKNNGDLFESELTGETWSKPTEMNKNINTEKFHESSASYSPDGKTLYFVTDKPGGFGDRDIYISYLDEKGKWGKAENLGPIINTEFGEEGVFMHPDGKTLYFSSQGHNSLGGYDIFKSVFDPTTKKWSVPENIGYPVNTTDDDVFFVVSADSKHGYYTSVNSNGFGGRDLYMISFLGAEKVEKPKETTVAKTETKIEKKQEEPQAKLTILKGVISDELTKKPLDATVEIIDNQLNKSITSFNSNSVSGKYLISLPAGKNYGIAVKKNGYLFHSENFNIPDTAAFQELSKDIALKKLEVGSTIVLKNIFYDFDKATLRQESTNELERLLKLLNEMPTLKIEISSHTDSKGANDYNAKLSENRAKSVVNFLIKSGISPDRLVSKGYGEEKPISTNDTEEGRQLNRRTEFKILSL
jgi:outer membrane protein OmpA-like peptidoglycan-associated protein